MSSLLDEGPYCLVWVRGLHRPEPQLWSQDAFFGADKTREQTVLSVRPLTAWEAVLSLRELAARYPPPTD